MYEQACLFVSGREGYHSYRIPALVRSDKGTILAFCEGRKNSRSDSGDIDIALRRSLDNGQTWGAGKILHAGPSAYSDLCIASDMGICCLYERGEENAYETIMFTRFDLEWLTDGADKLTSPL
jgi:hypothetical protein